jgi:hypothetical protein
MDITFDDRERRMLLAGAAGAVALGVLAGAAMRPDFGRERVLGPQYVSADGSVHEASYRPDPGVSVYGGRIPDYVIGTDWTQPRRETAYASASSAPREDPVVFTSDDEPPPSPMVMTYRTWREPPREASSYPSVDGDVRYRSEGRDEPYGAEAEEEPPPT